MAGRSPHEELVELLRSLNEAQEREAEGYRKLADSIRSTRPPNKPKGSPQARARRHLRAVASDVVDVVEKRAA